MRTRLEKDGLAIGAPVSLSHAIRPSAEPSVPLRAAAITCLATLLSFSVASMHNSYTTARKNGRKKADAT